MGDKGQSILSLRVKRSNPGLLCLRAVRPRYFFIYWIATPLTWLAMTREDYCHGRAGAIPRDDKGGARYGMTELFQRTGVFKFIRPRVIGICCICRRIHYARSINGGFKATGRGADGCIAGGTRVVCNC